MRIEKIDLKDFLFHRRVLGNLDSWCPLVHTQIRVAVGSAQPQYKAHLRLKETRLYIGFPGAITKLPGLMFAQKVICSTAANAAVICLGTDISVRQK